MSKRLRGLKVDRERAVKVAAMVGLAVLGISTLPGLLRTPDPPAVPPGVGFSPAEMARFESQPLTPPGLARRSRSPGRDQRGLATPVREKSGRAKSARAKTPRRAGNRHDRGTGARAKTDRPSSSRPESSDGRSKTGPDAGAAANGSSGAPTDESDAGTPLPATPAYSLAPAPPPPVAAPPASPPARSGPADGSQEFAPR